jgi:hypothetical protein
MVDGRGIELRLLNIFCYTNMFQLWDWVSDIHIHKAKSEQAHLKN